MAEEAAQSHELHVLRKSRQKPSTLWQNPAMCVSSSVNLKQRSSSTEMSWLCLGTAILPTLYFSFSHFSVLDTLSKVS